MTQTEQPRDCTVSDGEAALSVKGLWKIFGDKADKVIGTPDADLSAQGAAGEDRLRRRRSRTSPSRSRRARCSS